MMSKLRTRIYSAIFAGVAALGAVPLAYNAVVDPYRMHGLFDLGLAKEKIATKKHGQLYKAIEYPRLKSPYLVLGDSRARALRNKLFHQVGFTDMYNFAYSGGTLPEMVDTYWYAVEQADLKGIVLSVPLRMMTTDYYGHKNLVPEAIRMADSPMSYYQSMFVAETATEVLEKHFPDQVGLVRTAVNAVTSPISSANAAEGTKIETLGYCMRACRSLDVDRATGVAVDPFYLGRDVDGEIDLPISLIPGNIDVVGGDVDDLDVVTPNLDTPEVARDTTPPPVLSVPDDPESKWGRQIEKAGRNDWQDFVYSEDYFEKVREVVEDAQARGIKVALFIPPTHTDMQQRLIDFDMTAMNMAHRHRMAELAPVFDFDLPTVVNGDQSKFTDGYHFRASIANGISFELMRYFGAEEDTLKLIQKRRKKIGEGINCPIFRSDNGTMLPGTPTARMGNGCIVWGDTNDA